MGKYGKSLLMILDVEESSDAYGSYGRVVTVPQKIPETDNGYFMIPVGMNASGRILVGKTDIWKEFSAKDINSRTICVSYKFAPKENTFLAVPDYQVEEGKKGMLYLNGMKGVEEITDKVIGEIKKWDEATRFPRQCERWEHENSRRFSRLLEIGNSGPESPALNLTRYEGPDKPTQEEMKIMEFLYGEELWNHVFSKL